MLDYAEYTIEGNGYQGNGHNGYDKLEGEWLTYYKVAKGFVRRIKREDREDFLHDLFLVFAKVKASYDAKGKELTEGGLIRIAQYAVSDYWRKYYRRNKGIDCGQCSKTQRLKCKKDNYSECPKAIQLESLYKLIEDGNGDKTELYQLLADDNADFIPRLDAKLIIDNFPKRFVQLAYKKYAGYRLSEVERKYFNRQRQKARKAQEEVLI